MSTIELEWIVFCICRDINYYFSVRRLLAR